MNNDATYEMIDINDLRFAKYQRDLSGEFINKVLKNFDERLLGVILVSKRDGRYYVVDGQHRCVACQRAGVSKIYAEIRHNLSYNEEASIFRRSQFSRKLSPFADHKAGIEEADIESINIEKIVKESGLEFSKASADYKIAAVNTIYNLYKVYGEDILKRTLYLIAKSWKGDKNSLTKGFIMGIALFVNRFGDSFEDKLFIEKFSKIPPEDVIREARTLVSFSPNNNNPKAYVQILLYHFNKKMRKNKIGKRNVDNMLEEIMAG